MDMTEEKLQEIINKAVKRQVDEVKTEVEALRAKLAKEEEENVGDNATQRYHTEAEIIDMIAFI